MTDPAAIKGVRGGARLPPPQPVKAEGRRQAAGPAPGVARQNRQGRGNKIFRGEWHGKPRNRSDGDDLVPREPSEVEERSGEGLSSANKRVVYT